MSLSQTSWIRIKEFIRLRELFCDKEIISKHAKYLHDLEKKLSENFNLKKRIMNISLRYPNYKVLAKIFESILNKKIADYIIREEKKEVELKIVFFECVPKK